MDSIELAYLSRMILRLRFLCPPRKLHGNRECSLPSFLPPSHLRWRALFHFTFYLLEAGLQSVKVTFLLLSSTCWIRQEYQRLWYDINDLSSQSQSCRSKSAIIAINQNWYFDMKPIYSIGVMYDYHIDMINLLISQWNIRVNKWYIVSFAIWPSKGMDHYYWYDHINMI